MDLFGNCDSDTNFKDLNNPLFFNAVFKSPASLHQGGKETF